MTETTTSKPHDVESDPSAKNAVTGGADHKPGSTVFSLRFMLGLSLAFAVVFGVVGFVGRDWSSRQLTTAMSLICGWTMASGMIVYVALWKRRSRIRKYGAILVSAGGYASSVWWRWSTATGSVSVFGIWVILVITSIHFDATFKRLPHVLTIWIGGFMSQIILLIGLIARPGVLELHERGITWLTRIRDTRDYAEVIACNWAASPSFTGRLSLMLVLDNQGDHKVVRVSVPAKCQAAVDEVLTAKLGQRHVPGD